MYFLVAAQLFPGESSLPVAVSSISCASVGLTGVCCSFQLRYCVKASGRGAPAKLSKSECGAASAQDVLHRRGDLLSSDWSAGFNIDLVLDRLKQKEATKRVLFLHSRTFQYSKNMLVSNGGTKSCEEQDVFLRVSRRTEDGGTRLTAGRSGFCLHAGRPRVPR